MVVQGTEGVTYVGVKVEREEDMVSGIKLKPPYMPEMCFIINPLSHIPSYNNTHIHIYMHIHCKHSVGILKSSK